MKTSLTLAAMALVGATAACLDDSITGTRALGFTLSSDLTTVAIGEDVTFSLAAQGTGLRVVRVDFGDGVVDSTIFQPSTLEATKELVHSYTGSGSFMVRGMAEANDGTARDSVLITVN